LWRVYAVDVIAAADDATRQATVVQDEQGNAVDVLALQGDVEVHGVWLPSGSYLPAGGQPHRATGTPTQRVLVSGAVTQESGKQLCTQRWDTQFQDSSTPPRANMWPQKLHVRSGAPAKAPPTPCELPLRSAYRRKRPQQRRAKDAD
jgi:hypothetical protein